VVVRDDPASLTPYLHPPYGLWLACLDDKVVGCIALRPLDEHRGEIKRLYVQPEFRGQKLADRLLDALEEAAPGLGYRTLYLDTKDDLHAAIRFYQRRGYTKVARYNDNPQATMFMAREL
jgi:ribosomal protein S18 acetylase RimI-like enzyme